MAPRWVIGTLVLVAILSCRAGALERVRALAEEGPAIVLSTRDPDHVFLCGERVALLHGSRLAALGPPEEVVTPGAPERVYGARWRS